MTKFSGRPLIGMDSYTQRLEVTILWDTRSLTFGQVHPGAQIGSHADQRLDISIPVARFVLQPRSGSSNLYLLFLLIMKEIAMEMIVNGFVKFFFLYTVKTNARVTAYTSTVYGPVGGHYSSRLVMLIRSPVSKKIVLTMCIVSSPSKHLVSYNH